MGSLGFAVGAKLIFGAVVGAIAVGIIKAYYASHKWFVEPENLSLKTFGVCMFCAFFFIETVFAVVILAAFYLLGGLIHIVTGKEFKLTFSRFFFVHLPVATAIITVMSVMGNMSRGAGY